MSENNPQIMSDADLYLLIKKKDKTGFEHLYSKYSCTIYGLALQAVHSGSYAVEIVERTFLKIWDSIDLFINQNASMQVWMIQNLTAVIKDFLLSKNIPYTIKAGRFPFVTAQIEEDKTDNFQSFAASILPLNMI